METKPMISLPFIMLGMIFTILCTYGVWNVEVLYVDYNATLGTTSTSIHNMSYGEPYSFIFMFFFFIFMILFFRAGFNMWRVALQQQGEMDFKGKGVRRR